MKNRNRIRTNSAPELEPRVLLAAGVAQAPEAASYHVPVAQVPRTGSGNAQAIATQASLNQRYGYNRPSPSNSLNYRPGLNYRPSPYNPYQPRPNVGTYTYSPEARTDGLNRLSQLRQQFQQRGVQLPTQAPYSGGPFSKTGSPRRVINTSATNFNPGPSPAVQVARPTGYTASSGQSFNRFRVEQTSEGRQRVPNITRTIDYTRSFNPYQR